MRGALEGITVLEMANLRSGPYCTRMMADLGARVIKVEDPIAGGDVSRRYGPFPNDIPNPDKSGLFLWLNTNKKSVTLNLRTALGRRLFRELAEKIDILVEEAGPERMAGQGLSYDSLRAKNAGLIVTSISPFGHDGPYRDYKAYEINSSAAGGISVASGEPDREPLVMPIAAGEYQTGASAAGASLVAFLARQATGRGQNVDISEVEVLANNLVGQHMVTYLYRGVAGIRRGHFGGYFNYPNSCLPCKDGHMVLIAPQGAQWSRFLQIMGSPEWSKNPRYQDRRGMLERYPEEADAQLIPWFMEHIKEEIFALCKEHHIPFAPVRTIGELVADPQLQARHFFSETAHPEAGVLNYPSVGYELSDSPANTRSPAPRLGEHNREIYCEYLGYSPDDLRRMEEIGGI